MLSDVNGESGTIEVVVLRMERSITRVKSSLLLLTGSEFPIISFDRSLTPSKIMMYRAVAPNPTVGSGFCIQLLVE
ncbi:hypothetical protein D3C81_1248610 [compost metagenome]